MQPSVAIWGPEEFQHATAVSRETLDRLNAYHALLCKWTGRINLIGPKTLPHIWRRHFYDSWVLTELIESSGKDGSKVILDLGSGAGFPGLILAIAGVGKVHLVEADERKALFLREAARITGSPVTVHQTRLESLASFPVDFITARAFAPLSQILSLSKHFWQTPAISKEVTGLFLKGESFREELTAAAKNWTLCHEVFPNPSDKRGIVLRVVKPQHIMEQ